MLRNEIQNKTGLTRKAIEYYEERGIVKPNKSSNGYRDYTEKDLEILTKVSLLRKVGMNISEIEKFLASDGNSLSSILRKRQYKLDMEEKKKAVLELIVKGENYELIKESIASIEVEESIYEKLEKAFPGYFGQMMFSAYQPFLNEPLGKNGKEAYYEYVNYLDELPTFELTEEEQKYIDKLSRSFDMENLKEINEAKISAVNDVEHWLKSNKDNISKYEEFKNSKEYQSSQIKQIQDKLQKYMTDNKYYETAIPFIRTFSKSYDEYYKKLLEANEKYLNTNV